VRTDPGAPKHKGITAMVIDLTAPGVQVRPLREITGDAMFNEVFFDDVFVPDDDVVGEVNGGWGVARTTLGNERVSIGGGMMGGAAFELIPLLTKHAPDDAGLWREAGRLLADEMALSAVNLRQVARAVAGGQPGPEGAVTKVITSQHLQRASELSLRILGPSAVDGSEPKSTNSYLLVRSMTIAGGTTEIGKNVIAERILGLPRDPLARLSPGGRPPCRPPGEGGRTPFHPLPGEPAQTAGPRALRLTPAEETPPSPGVGQPSTPLGNPLLVGSRGLGD
jgi:alkylation response protein AidB-like acyl-CoA dehydrogenase